jgi:TRAP-type transport system periplasmic protein
MKSRQCGWIVGALGLLLLMFPLSTVMAAPKVIHLKFANFFPPPSKQSQLCEAFVADLETRTHGQVKIQYFAGGSLLKPNAVVRGVETGVADFGFGHIAYTTGRFPVTEACELPLGFPTGWVANEIMNDFYEKFKPKEWDTVVPLWFHANTPSILATKKPLRTLEDFKGMTIRAPGLMGEVISALGGTPAPTNIMETYDAISKGVLQGVFVGGEGIKTFRFGDVVNYVTNSWNVGPSYPFYVIMNKNKYAKLPPSVRTVLDKLSGEYKEKFALLWNAADFPGEAYGKSKGVEYIELPKAEFDRWYEAVQPVIEKYVHDMVAIGFAESEVRGWIDYLKTRKDELLKKQIELQIKSTTGPPEVRL